MLKHEAARDKVTYSDYLEPRYRFRLVARAAGFSLNTLRSNFQREWFRSFTSGLGTGQGRAQRLCLGDVLVLAIASRLIAFHVHPVEAYNAAFPFGLVAKTPKGLPIRLPFELFDRAEFDTVFIWRPGATAQIMPVPRNGTLPLSELGLDNPDGEAALALSLNAVEATVFEKLGLALPEPAHDE